MPRRTYSSTAVRPPRRARRGRATAGAAAAAAARRELLAGGLDVAVEEAAKLEERQVLGDRALPRGGGGGRHLQQLLY